GAARQAGQRKGCKGEQQPPAAAAAAAGVGGATTEVATAPDLHRSRSGASSSGASSNNTYGGTYGSRRPAGGEYDIVMVAAGAAAGTLAEVRRAGLPLQLCQGLTLVMAPPAPPPPAATTPPAPPLRDMVSPTAAPADPAPPAAPSYPPGRPSLLGQPYLAAQGPGRLVVGATKQYGWTAEAALEACGRSEYAEVTHGSAGMAAAAAEGEKAEEEVDALLRAACEVWEPLRGWQLERVREGVRALPPRTTHGSLPLLGRLVPGRRWWLVGGLGSRGLVYHGWLGRLAAEAALRDEEGGLPGELTAWRGVAAGEARFDAP
ncbi:hypothetical protein Agub_g7205, partial [Astrephomene gubernaculifera]